MKGDLGSKRTRRVKKRLTLIEARVSELEEQVAMIAAVVANPGQLVLVEESTKDTN